MQEGVRAGSCVLTKMRCAVLGQPIAHSLSPAMHRAAYRQFGLSWEYEAIEVAEGGLADFLAQVDETWQGFSVTAPLKGEAAQIADVRSAVVEQLGVANTLIPGNSGWIASNTDVPGALSALHARGIDAIESVRILGAGATATSLVLVAQTLGARTVELCVRNRDRAVELVEFAEKLGLRVNVAAIDATPNQMVDLLVNTVPAFALAGNESAFVKSARSVFEAVYDPWPTNLMNAAQAQDVPLVTGIDLLAHQATLQLTAMTGRHIDADVLAGAALDELSRR